MKCSAMSTMPNVGQPRIPSDNKGKVMCASDNTKMSRFCLFAPQNLPSHCKMQFKIRATESTVQIAGIIELLLATATFIHIRVTKVNMHNQNGLFSVHVNDSLMHIVAKKQTCLNLQALLFLTTLITCRPIHFQLEMSALHFSPCFLLIFENER